MATTLRSDAVSPPARVVRLGAKGHVPGERGLPKPEVTEAEFTAEGVVGDHNVFRASERSGDPAMAVLVIPSETIEDLNRAGWPVRPGDLGENVSTRGLPYEELRAGRRFRLGSAEIEISKVCDPCTNLYSLPYVGDARGPAFLKATLGRRGWYARVVRAGRTRRGDAFVPVANS